MKTPNTAYTLNDISGALEASSNSTSQACYFYKMSGYIDSSAPSDDYWVQIWKQGTVPADTTATGDSVVTVPIKVQHVTGTDSYFSVNLEGVSKNGKNGIYCPSGVSWNLSTTAFTKTVGGAYVSGHLMGGFEND